MTPTRKIIATTIVTVTGVSPRYQYTICPLLEGSQNELRIHTPGAGNANYPYISRVLHPVKSGQVSTGI
jgi:hypothetical protein